MLGELDFYLPKSFCSTNVYGEYTEGKNSIVGVWTKRKEGPWISSTEMTGSVSHLSWIDRKSGYRIERTSITSTGSASWPASSTKKIFVHCTLF